MNQDHNFSDISSAPLHHYTGTIFHCDIEAKVFLPSPNSILQLLITLILSKSQLTTQDVANGTKYKNHTENLSTLTFQIAHIKKNLGVFVSEVLVMPGCKC